MDLIPLITFVSFPSSKVPGSSIEYFMLIFALNFLEAIVFIYAGKWKKETHKYMSCHVRGFLIIP